MAGDAGGNKVPPYKYMRGTVSSSPRPPYEASTPATRALPTHAGASRSPCHPSLLPRGRSCSSREWRRAAGRRNGDVICHFAVCRLELWGGRIKRGLLWLGFAALVARARATPGVTCGHGARLWAYADEDQPGRSACV